MDTGDMLGHVCYHQAPLTVAPAGRRRRLLDPKVQRSEVYPESPRDQIWSQNFSEIKKSEPTGDSLHFAPLHLEVEQAAATACGGHVSGA